MYTVTLVRMHAHTAASVLGENTKLIVCLKEKMRRAAAVYETLLQTCARVQESERLSQQMSIRGRFLNFNFLAS